MNMKNSNSNQYNSLSCPIFLNQENLLTVKNIHLYI